MKWTTHSRPEWYRYGRDALTDAPVQERWRASHRFLRVVGWSVLLFFLNATIWPTWAVAAEAHQQQQQRQEAKWQADNTQLSQVLQHIQEQVDQQKGQIDGRLQTEGGTVNNVLTFLGLSQLATENTDHLQWLAHRADTFYQQSLHDFAETAKHLKHKHLPGVIEQRNQQALALFQQRHAEMQAKLNALLTANSLLGQQDAANDLHTFLQGFVTERPRPKLDPHHLPWGTPNPKLTRKPAQTANQLSDLTGVPRFLPSQMLASNTPVASDQPTADDLAATPDAQLSPAIVAKAAALNNNPVTIYQWVRNNITFIPSYGSIQGADYTLQHGAGNAFDTASLLIALLRAAHVPARYAMGTVNIPAAEVMNWVGNVTTPEAAGNLMLQGGIPNTMLLTGGQVSAFQMEHIWVEAWIDYQPSRGAKNLTGDSWVPMDASFKQYTYTTGADLQTAVPFDAQALATTLQQQSTINTTQGWVQNVPQQPIQDALTNYQTQLQTYINNQNPTATVGDILGTQAIKTVIHQTLSSTLPYHLVTRSLATPTLPDDLRWKFTYQLSTADQSGLTTPLLTITQPTVTLAGQKLTLSFKPATPADEATLESYLPAPGANGQIDPSQLPSSLPGYLINLTGEFAINGQSVATASDSTPMGTALSATMGYWQPGQGWHTSDSNPIAGEYHAIGLDLQGISQTQAQTLQTNLTATQTALAVGDYTNLTKEQVVGDLLYGTILSYFALNDVQNQIAAPQVQEVTHRAPSYGEFHTSVSAQYWYGLPQTVDANGMTMDVARLMEVSVDKSNDTQKWIAFNQAINSRASAMEGLVPQHIYSTSAVPAQSISAVAALALANAQGQKIWTITQSNLSTALASIQLPAAVVNDITNAVNAGEVVTTQSKPVAYAGGNFTGYLVIDPATGAGGYLLDNGTNGAHIVSEYLKELFWSALEELGGKLGALASAINEAVSQLIGYINIDLNCPLPVAAMGIYFIATIAIMLVLLTPESEIVGALFIVLYRALSAITIAQETDNLVEACKKE